VTGVDGRLRAPTGRITDGLAGSKCTSGRGLRIVLRSPFIPKKARAWGVGTGTGLSERRCSQSSLANPARFMQ